MVTKADVASFERLGCFLTTERRFDIDCPLGYVDCKTSKNVSAEQSSGDACYNTELTFC